MSDDEAMANVIGWILGIIIVIIMAAVGSISLSTSTIHADLVEANEASLEKLLEGRRLPVLENSLDFDNAKQRYEVLNSKGNVGWLYVFSTEGVLLIETPVMGKLTDTNTYITPMEEIKRSRASSDDPWEYFTVEMSDLDGTYGVNANSVFWFSPDESYNEIALTSPIVIYSAERKSYDAAPMFSDYSFVVR